MILAFSELFFPLHVALNIIAFWLLADMSMYPSLNSFDILRSMEKPFFVNPVPADMLL